MDRIKTLVFSLLKARVLCLDQALNLLIDWEIVFLQLFRSDIVA